MFLRQISHIRWKLLIEALAVGGSACDSDLNCCPPERRRDHCFTQVLSSLFLRLFYRLGNAGRGHGGEDRAGIQLWGAAFPLGASCALTGRT